MDLNHHPLILAYNANNSFGEYIGMSFTILSPGLVRYELEIHADLLATPNAAHGGVLATLLDAALGVAALSAVCERNQVVSTIELTTRFHAPTRLGDQLIASARLLSVGKRILVAEGSVMNQRNELVASATGTFNAYPKEKAGL